MRSGLMGVSDEPREDLQDARKPRTRINPQAARVVPAASSDP
jgi:hypothetical protein